MDFIGKIDSTKDLVNKEYVDGLWTSDKIVSTLGTTAVAKATDADTVDGFHYTTQNDIGYTHYKTVTLATTSVWYVSMACTRNYASELQWIAVNPEYDNNMAEMRICLYDYRGKWRALTSEYNNCNVLGMQTSLGNNPTLYFKMRAPASSGTFRVWAPFNFTLTASTTAPSGVTFDDIIQGALIGYERLRINGISPITDNTNSLGTSSLRWSSVYTYGLFAAGNANIDGTLNVGGNASVKMLSVKGSANSSGYISADSATNMFMYIGDKYMLVADSTDNTIRRGSTNADATLGTSTYPWANVYATTFTGKATDADHADAATNSDTIDGFHVATMPGIANTLSNNTMLAMRAQTIDLSDTSVYSTSNYYPITFPVSRACGFVDVRLSYISSPYQYIDFLVRGASYYGVTNKVIVREITRWSGNWYIGCIGAGSSTNALCCIWLKGGYSYRVISNSTFTAHSANYTNGSCTYTVGTNPYGGTNTNVTVMFTPGAGAGEEGIGPSTQSSAAYMSGSLRVNGGLYTNSNISAQGYIRAVGEITGFYSSSDLRLKKNFADLNLGLDAVANLPLKSYDRTDRNNKRTDGTIAQEVQKLLPNEVYDRGDGYLAMAEGQLGLIFGINAHKEIKRLSERVKKLERLIEDMDNGMERLAEMN